MPNWLRILLWLATSCHALRKGGLRTRRLAVQVQQNNNECFTCHVARVEILVEENSGQEALTDPLYSCITYIEDHSYQEIFDIQLPKSFLETHEKVIEAGNAHVCIPGGYVDRETSTVVVPDHAKLQLVADETRRLNSGVRNGKKKLLAIRIRSNNNEEPEESLTQIEGAIFGTGQDAMDASVVGQFKDVSHGALQYEAARGENIFNGVAEVTINATVAGTQILGALADTILAASAAKVGPLDQIADRVIFCIPDDSLLQGSATWTAFTFLYERYSYYQKSRCTRLSVVVHELGHSLGFKHSGVGVNQYADESGYMGYSKNQLGGPRKAFNGHKHWLSGWYSDSTLSVNPMQRILACRLVSFVDYGNSRIQNEDAVILRVGKLYVQYNKIKGYNVEYPDIYKDKVTIVEATADLDVSDYLGGVGNGESYAFSNYDGKGNDLIIQACAMKQEASELDYVELLIYLDDGQQSPSCNSFEALRQPTKSPTKSPTVSPTSAPTEAPTDPTTGNPFLRTQNPTLTISPSAAPSERMSNAPTLVPSSLPSYTSTIKDDPPLDQAENEVNHALPAVMIEKKAKVYDPRDNSRLSHAERL